MGIKVTGSCNQCSTPFVKLNTLGKYCSNTCQQQWQWHNIIRPEIEAGQRHHRPRLKQYLVEERGWGCEVCSTKTWCGKDIPLELDHIDGNASNNFPCNLRLICPNCHAQTPTAKGRNRGSGRKMRGLRVN